LSAHVSRRWLWFVFLFGTAIFGCVIVLLVLNGDSGRSLSDVELNVNSVKPVVPIVDRSRLLVIPEVGFGTISIVLCSLLALLVWAVRCRF
jgi:hypothetical protein